MVYPGNHAATGGVYYMTCMFTMFLEYTVLKTATFNEADFIHQAQQGDDAAWSTLVRRHQQAVFRLAWLLVGDADDAEDVAQTVFIRAARSLTDFDPERPLRPWLLQITRHQASNWRRSVRRYVATLQRYLQGRPETAEAEDDALAHATDADLLWQAVRRLDQADQEIIYLRYFLELPVEETAQALTIAPGTVKSRTSRARSRLRAIVEEEFPTLCEERMR